MAAIDSGKTPEHLRLEEARTGAVPWKAWGPSERAPVGHRARGLQPGRRRVERLPTIMPADAPTAGARTESPGSPTSASGCVCRWRCGTRPIRSSRSGCSASPTAREIRRGCQGVLVLPRQHSDAFLPQVPVQVSPALVPVSGPGLDQRPAQQAGDGIRTARHRHLRSGPLLRRDRRVRKRRSRRHPDARHGAQPRSGGRGPAPAADVVVPQHLVLGR